MYTPSPLQIDIGVKLVEQLIKDMGSLIDAVIGALLSLFVTLLSPILIALYGISKEFALWAPYPGSSTGSGVTIFQRPPEGDVFYYPQEIIANFMEPVSITLVSVGIILIVFISVFDAGLPSVDLGVSSNRQKVLIAPFLVVLWIPLASLLLLISAGVTDLFTSLEVAQAGSELSSASYNATLQETTGFSADDGVQKLFVLLSFLPALLFTGLAALFGALRTLGLIATFTLGPLAIAFWAVDFKGIEIGLGSLGRTVIKRYSQLVFYPVPAAFALEMIPLFSVALNTIIQEVGGGLLGELGPILADVFIIVITPAVVAFAPITTIIGVKKATGAAAGTGAAALSGGLAAGYLASGPASSAAKSATSSLGSKVREKSDFADSAASKAGNAYSGFKSSVDSASQRYRSVDFATNVISETNTRGVAMSAASKAGNAAAGNKMLENYVPGGTVVSQTAQKTKNYSPKEKRDKARKAVAKAKRKDKEARFKRGRGDAELPDGFSAADDTTGDRIRAEREAFMMNTKNASIRDMKSLAEEYTASEHARKGLNSVDDMDENDKQDMARWAYDKMINGEIDELERKSQSELMDETESLSYNELLRTEDNNGNSIGLKYGISQDDSVEINDEEIEIESTDGGILWDISQSSSSSEVSGTYTTEDEKNKDELVGVLEQILPDEIDAERAADEYINEGENSLQSYINNIAEIEDNDVAEEHAEIVADIIDDSEIAESAGLALDASNKKRGEEVFSFTDAITTDGEKALSSDDIEYDGIRFDADTTQNALNEALDRAGVSEDFTNFVERAIVEADGDEEKMKQILDGNIPSDFEEAVSEDDLEVIQEAVNNIAEMQADELYEVLDSHDIVYEPSTEEMEAYLDKILSDDAQLDSIEIVEDLSIEEEEFIRETIDNNLVNDIDDLTSTEIENELRENLDMDSISQDTADVIEKISQQKLGVEEEKMKVARQKVREQANEEVQVQIQDVFEEVNENMESAIREEYDSMIEENSEEIYSAITDSFDADRSEISRDALAEEVFDSESVRDVQEEVDGVYEILIGDEVQGDESITEISREKFDELRGNAEIEDRLGKIEDEYGKEVRDEIVDRTMSEINS